MANPTPLDLHPNPGELRRQLAEQHQDTTLGHVYDIAREVIAAFHFFTHRGVDTDTAVELTAITLNNIPEE